MEILQYSIEELTKTGNIVKDLVIGSMEKEGVISSDEKEKWLTEYFVTIHKPSRLTQFWKKVFRMEKEDPDEFVWMVSKKIS